MAGLSEILQKVYPENGHSYDLDETDYKEYKSDIEPLIIQRDPDLIQELKRGPRDFLLANKGRIDSIDDYLKDNKIFLKITKGLSKDSKNGISTSFINSNLEKAVVINDAQGEININMAKESQLKERIKQIISLSVKEGEKEVKFTFTGKFSDLTEDDKAMYFLVFKQFLPNLTKEQLEYLAGSMIVKIKKLNYDDLTKIQEGLKGILKVGDRELLDIEVVEKSKSEAKEKGDSSKSITSIAKFKNPTNASGNKKNTSGFKDFGGEIVSFQTPNEYGIAASTDLGEDKDLSRSFGSVKSKYKAVLNLGQELGIQDGDISEEGGILKIKGQANTPYEKNALWDKIKKIGGENPSDINANISVADNSVYHRHTVRSGESLSKIAKHYYGDAMKYNKIFEANSGILKNPDLINPNQIIIIPNIE